MDVDLTITPEVLAEMILQYYGLCDRFVIEDFFVDQGTTTLHVVGVASGTGCEALTSEAA